MASRKRKYGIFRVAKDGRAYILSWKKKDGSITAANMSWASATNNPVEFGSRKDAEMFNGSLSGSGRYVDVLKKGGF